MALNVDTDKSQNLELLLDAADFAKFLKMEDFNIMSYTKPLNANRIGFGPVMAKVSSPYLFKSYNNLNCIKDLSKILNFSTPTGGHKCIKEHLECLNQNWKSAVPSESSKF